MLDNCKLLYLNQTIKLYFQYTCILVLLYEYFTYIYDSPAIIAFVIKPFSRVPSASLSLALSLYLTLYHSVSVQPPNKKNPWLCIYEKRGSQGPWGTRRMGGGILHPDRPPQPKWTATEKKQKMQIIRKCNELNQQCIHIYIYTCI